MQSISAGTAAGLLHIKDCQQDNTYKYHADNNILLFLQFFFEEKVAPQHAEYSVAADCRCSNDCIAAEGEYVCKLTNCFKDCCNTFEFVVFECNFVFFNGNLF